MASSVDYLNYVLDNLRKVDNITYKRMMGEYLIYSDGILFGGIYDDRFLIKITKSNEELDLAKEIPYPGAKPMYLVDSENPELIKEIVMKCIADLK